MELRMVSPQIFPLVNSEINIYGDFMHLMMFDDYGGLAVIIEGSDIVKLHKTLFEIAWKFCEDSSSQSFLQLNEEKFSDPEEFLKSHTYITDNMGEILKRIHFRKNKFPPDLKEKWAHAKPEYVEEETGEHILKICDLEVMSDFQKPYMKHLAKISTMHGGKILNMGYGLGLVDEYIEQKRETRSITEHHIIEYNHDVLEHARAWREKQKNKESIFLHEGDWEEILPKLEKTGISFDGVVYDGYPLQIDELCRDSIRFLYSLIHLKLLKEKTGVLTFFMDSSDGFGESFQKYLRCLRVGKFQVSQVDVDLPDRFHEHWNTPYFLAPLLTDVRYS